MDKQRQKKLKIELYNDNFQNFKSYGIPKAQLVIADIPYNIGANFYGSNPSWYVDGDRKNGESNKAGRAAFNSDFNFNIVEYFHFCNRLLKKEPKERGSAPCMIVFCSFQQIPFLLETAKKYGFQNSQHISFIKKLFPAGIKSKYADLRRDGTCDFVIS